MSYIGLVKKIAKTFSLNFFVNIYNCENFILFFIILAIIVFHNEPHNVALADAVGTE